MRFKTVFPLVFALAVLWPVGLRAQSAEALFQQGIAAFQKSDFDKARSSFSAALGLDSDNPLLLFNLGMTEQKAGSAGRALALWRKALAVDPGFSAASSAIEWTKGRLERAEIAHEVEFWETFRRAVLVDFSLEKFLFATAIFLFGAGWLILGNLGARRRARLDEKPMPSFPYSGTALATGFVICTALSVAKAIDMGTIRATVVEKKIAALSSPDVSATQLFELYEGLEVIVQQRKGEWAQVTYPGASTGWVQRKAIFAIDDRVAP